MGEWQPIETAPRDGTRVLLLRPQKQSGPTLVKNPVIGSWNTKRGAAGYWALEVTANNYAVRDGELSAWQPLPEPPK